MSYRFLKNTPLCRFEREMQIIPGFGHYIADSEYINILSAIMEEMQYANFKHQIIRKIMTLELGNLNFKDTAHKKRFGELKWIAKKKGYLFIKTKKGLAIAFLLTANEMLFKRAIPCMNDCGFSFEQISLKGANEEMYDLYQAARFINDGTTNLTLCDLAEPEIVCDYIVKLV